MRHLISRATFPTTHRAALAAALVFVLTMQAAHAADGVEARAAADTSATAGAGDSETHALELVADARTAAGRDRHGEALAAYAAALHLDARLLPQLAREMAFQALWNDEADRAVLYFRRHLEGNPDDDSRELRQGLALACSWSGRQPEAIAMYRGLAREDSSDGGVRVGLGRALMWNNQLSEGYRELRGIETGIFASHEAGREAGDFLLTALDEYTPPLAATLSASWDSDDLDIVRLSVIGTTTVGGNKLAQFMPTRTRYRQREQPEITGLRLGGGMVAPLAHNWTLRAYGWLDRFRSDLPLLDAPADLEWDRGGGELWLTWLPASRWRLDFGADSSPVETYAAMNNRIGRRQASTSVDWRPARRWTTGATAGFGDYSDGNKNRLASAHLTWQHEGRWHLRMGPVARIMDYQTPYPGSYWAPDQVRSGGFETTVRTRGRVVTFLLNGSVAREKEKGARAVTVGGVSGRIGWRFAAGWLAAVEAGKSQSSFSSAGGYSRTSVSLDVRAFF